jgi:hypothetical protein
MYRMLLVGVFALSAAPARADTLPLIFDTPSTYVQGTPFTLDVRLPGTVDMTGFSVQLVITTMVLNPILDITAEAIPGRYPFLNTSNFGTSQAMVLDSNVRYVDFFTLTPDGPVNTYDSDNDMLAHLTITPGGNVTGPIIISVNDTNLILSIGGEPPPEVILPIAILDDATPPSAVPAPAAWLSLGIGGLVLAGRRRRATATV